MENIMAYDTTVLVTHVLVVAIATIGIVQWLKNWVNCKRRRTYSIVGLICLAFNVLMQMPFINSTVTWGWNLFALGLAVMQFGYEAIIQGIPMLINRAMSGGNAQQQQQMRGGQQQNQQWGDW